MDREGKMEQIAPGTPAPNTDEGIEPNFLGETMAEARAVGGMWLTLKYAGEPKRLFR